LKLEDKILNLLHLARKAGKLQFGFDACERSCFSSQAKLVIYASDLSPNTQKNLIKIIQANNVKSIELSTKKNFGNTFKIRETGIMIVNDSNFAKGILSLIV
jgi:ribosomal protein L7Ae-like RNA K-turn-binding protein